MKPAGLVLLVERDSLAVDITIASGGRLDRLRLKHGCGGRVDGKGIGENGIAFFLLGAVSWWGGILSTLDLDLLGVFLVVAILGLKLDCIFLDDLIECLAFRIRLGAGG
jgi:hypothetical protein